MPEFIMEGRDHAARAESYFVLGFIEAMFFTNTGNFHSDEFDSDETQHAIAEGQSDGTLPYDAGYLELESDTLKSIRAFCDHWQRENAATLESAYSDQYDETQAGRDLWFTTQGHGVGFWDRGLGDIGDTLSDAATLREMCPYWNGSNVAIDGLPTIKESENA